MLVLNIAELWQQTNREERSCRPFKFMPQALIMKNEMTCSNEVVEVN